MSILHLTSAQLRKAANLKESLDELHKKLAAISGQGDMPAPLKSVKKKGGMSAAGKAKIAAAQKARWAKVNAAKSASTPKTVAKVVKKKFTMSAAAKAKISAAAKARWAKIKAAKK
jgi:hypothetical protein